MTIERRPSSLMWKRRQAPQMHESQGSRWQRGHLNVLSGLDKMKSPVTGEPVPTWHVSVSSSTGYVDDDDLATVRRVFGMDQAEEDNHEPGRARHLFLCVQPEHRAECECNVSEATFVEPSGHVWRAPPAEEFRRRQAMAALASAR